MPRPIFNDHAEIVDWEWEPGDDDGDEPPADPPEPNLEIQPVDDIDAILRENAPRFNVGLGVLRPALRDDIWSPYTKSSTDYFGFINTITSVFNRGGFAMKKQESYIGLEFENEVKTEFALPAVPGWKFHQEGSLRNFGFEYVQATPNTVDKSLTSAASLLEILNNRASPQKFSNSIRTSTHVHFDVGAYNFMDILNFASLYWILEDYLSTFCGESRKGNLFCLRLKDSSVIQTMLTDAVQKANPWNTVLVNNDYRYASVNFASIPKFGSLEFRMMRGVSDYLDIETWVRALEAIKQYALRFKTPLELDNHFIRDVSARELPMLVFGKSLNDRLNGFSSLREIETSVREGFLSVHPLLTSHPTFDFSKEIEEERVKRKKEEEAYELKQLRERERQRARAEERMRHQPLPLPNIEGPDEQPDQHGIHLVDFVEYVDE